MCRKKAGREVVDWMHLAQVRVRYLVPVVAVMNLWVLYKTVKFLTSSAITNFS